MREGTKYIPLNFLPRTDRCYHRFIFTMGDSWSVWGRDCGGTRVASNGVYLAMMGVWWVNYGGVLEGQQLALLALCCAPSEFLWRGPLTNKQLLC